MTPLIVDTDSCMNLMKYTEIYTINELVDAPSQITITSLV